MKQDAYSTKRQAVKQLKHQFAHRKITKRQLATKHVVKNAQPKTSKTTKVARKGKLVVLVAIEDTENYGSAVHANLAPVKKERKPT